MRSDLTQSSSTSSLSVSPPTHDKQAKAKSPVKRQPQRPRTAEREGAVKRLRARYPELDRLYQREQELEETVAKKRWIAVPDLGRRHPDDARIEKFFPHYRPLKTRLVIDGQEELEKVREAIQREVFMEICKSPWLPSWQRGTMGQAASMTDRTTLPAPRRRSPKASSKTTKTSSRDLKTATASGMGTSSHSVAPCGGERATGKMRAISGRKAKPAHVSEPNSERGAQDAIVVVPHPVPSSLPIGNEVQQLRSDASSTASISARSDQASSHHSRRTLGKLRSSDRPLPPSQALSGTLAEGLFATTSQNVSGNGAGVTRERRSGIGARATQSQDARSSRGSESRNTAAAEKAAERAHILQLLDRLKLPDTVTLDWMPEGIVRIQVGYQHAPVLSSDDPSEVRARVINSHWNFHAQAALQALADCYGNFIKQLGNNAAGMSNGPLIGALSDAMRDAGQQAETRIAAQLTQDERQLLFPAWVGTAHLNSLQRVFEFEPEEYTGLFDGQGMVRASLSREDAVGILQKRVADEWKRIVANYEEYRKTRGLTPNVPRAKDGVR